MFGEKMTAMKKKDIHEESVLFKSPFLGLRQFLAAESPLKMMKNALYFMLKAVFVCKIFSFLP